MTLRRLALLWLTLGALLASPVVADDVPDEDEAPAPPQPPPPPPPRQPAPPPERPAPRPEPARPAPPPPRPAPVSDYEPTGFYFAPELVALQFDNSDTEFGTDATSGDTASVDTDHDLGWRLGLGYRWANKWDLMFRGTNVNSDESRTIAQAGVAGIGTTFGAGFDTASANVDIDYTTLDAEVGYTWGAWERSHLRLFFGPRMIWIDQELTSLFDPDTGIAGDRTATNEEMDVEALGLAVGVEGTIAFNPHWSIILEAYGGIYNADFENDYIRTTGDGAVIAATSSMDDDDTIHELGGSLSFQWQRRAFEDGMFGIRFGWELSHLDDVPSLSDFAATSGPNFVDDEFDSDGPFVRFEWIF
jgi:hypothetical protein